MKTRIIPLLFLMAITGAVVYWFGGQGPVRFVASDGLSEGQRDKLELIQSLRLERVGPSIVLSTDYLEVICLGSREIEVVYAAVGVAINGESPEIRHTFSCDSLAEHGRPGELRTELADLEKLRKDHAFSTPVGELSSRLLYAGDEFPPTWRLKEIVVRGDQSFLISEYELEKILGQAPALDLH